MMFGRPRCRNLSHVLRRGAAAIALCGAVPAFAQEAASPAPALPNGPSESAVANLVRLLVEQGTITRENGERLLAQAQSEAVQARAAAPARQASADLPPPAPGTVRVPYVPETVRAQIRDEIKTEVLAQAQREGWAAPDRAAPAWVNNIRLTGDFRFRSASSLFAENNSNLFIDVAEFNANGPYDITTAPTTVVPTLNTTKDRGNVLQIRARLGLEATIAERFKLGFQIATGDDNGPISTNSTLNGGFRKRDLWLQLAYLSGEIFPGGKITVGRFENPLRHTDLMFDPDLALDGVFGEVDFSRIIGVPNFTVALRGGGFPIDFGDNDFPSTAFEKRNFRDRYLVSTQIELGGRFNNGIEASLSAAYHNFTYLRGHVSAPCDVYTSANVECSTDALRPLYATKGNTLMFLRSFDTALNPDPANPIEPQFLGLKFAYRVLDVNGSVSVPISDRVQARLTGNYLHNFGFDPENICNEGFAGRPINNISNESGVCGPASTGRFVGGNEGYAAYLSLGNPDLFRGSARLAKRGDWAVSGGYKYLESDAVPDSFPDSDFHLGGTNAQGYFVGGQLAVLDNITLGARWLSADEIVDQPLSIDVLQLDLGVAF